MNVLLFHMRAVLQFSGVTVEQSRGLFVPQAVSSELYSNDSTLKNRANELLAKYRLRPSTQTSPTSDTSAGPTTTESNNESSRRRVDAGNRRFNEYERYSGILAQSPNLAETKKAYLTYCSQKDFPRADRVKLISCVLKGPALNYGMSSIQNRPELTELGSVFRQLESQFDTPAHQRQIESLTLSMTIGDVRKKKSCSRVSALGYLYHEVARLNEQFPKVKSGGRISYAGIEEDRREVQVVAYCRRGRDTRWSLV